VSWQTRATVDLPITGSSKVSSSAASMSRTDSPRKNEQMISDSSAYVRATCRPRMPLSNPSSRALRTRGRSSSTGPAVVTTRRGS
jgi:hypothetical protein